VNFDSKTTHGSAPQPIEFHLGTLMRELNERLSEGLEYHKVLDFVFNSLSLIIPFDRMGVALIEDAGDQAKLKLEWMKSKAPVNHLERNYSVALKSSSLAQLIETNVPRIINDLLEYAVAHPSSESTKLIIKDGVRSSLTCPLRSGKQAIGVIFFSSFHANTYLPSHVKTFTTIADELAVIVDYARLKQASELYSSQSKSLRLLLHDLRSPLSIIQGFVKASFDEDWFKDLDSDAKQIFEILLRNSDQMFDLINEVLEVARLNQNIDLLKKEWVNISDFADQMKYFGTTIGEEKHIHFQASLFCDGHTVAYFDKDRIRRVIENLFSNAVKFSEVGKGVSFSIVIVEDRIHFAVTDEGVGIPEDELPLLFREFGKTSAKPTAGETSTGLGLAIAKKLVEQHGGQIKATSEIGFGSSFSFWIPLGKIGSLDVRTDASFGASID
jgi:signal transduction histidine kinase